jgi:hypothetical protein
LTDIEAYLDRACAGLKINPAQADDIREELRSHLEETLLTQGVELNDAAAVRAALSGFGDPEKLAEFLGLVHQGERPWRRRFKGLLIGLSLGFILSWLGGKASEISPLGRFFLAPIGGASPVVLWLNCLGLGGLIGLLSVIGKPLLLGWWIGFFAWIIELAILGATTLIGAGTPAAASNSLPAPSLLLLTPLLGGCFGLFIALSARGISFLISCFRPEIR